METVRVTIGAVDVSCPPEAVAGNRISTTSATAAIDHPTRRLPAPTRMTRSLTFVHLEARGRAQLLPIVDHEAWALMWATVPE
jgi:hypothetical protein